MVSAPVKQGLGVLDARVEERGMMEWVARAEVKVNESNGTFVAWCVVSLLAKPNHAFLTLVEWLLRSLRRPLLLRLPVHPVMCHAESATCVQGLVD
jgi:hypothetical protein